VASLVAYTRVSSDQQRENTSLEHQIKRIRGYCDAQEHILVAHYEDVETASGRRERKGFKEALELVYAGNADGIICMKLDRFARNTIEGLQTAAELKQHGKHLVILDLQLDTSTPVGQCIFTVLLAFAQLERDTIAERCNTGRINKRAKGEYYGGTPPYGWEVLDGTLVEQPLEQFWRQAIFEWRRNGMSYQRITDKLNDMAVPAKKGGYWDTRTVWQLVNRPLKLSPLLGIENHEDECSA
jgi:site-specific DNA recombinase